eukprot:m.241301 g.241301  ORF g.241301 m.241301 type:complete len:144 (-) comp54420_c0_seq7:191-622(-)
MYLATSVSPTVFFPMVSSLSRGTVSAAVYGLARSLTGERFVSGSRDQTVVVWSIPDWTKLREIQLPQMVTIVAFSTRVASVLYVGILDLGVLTLDVDSGIVQDQPIAAHMGGVWGLQCITPPSVGRGEQEAATEFIDVPLEVV